MNRFTPFFIAATAMLLPGAETLSQTNGYKDRLSQVKDVVNSTELVMIWSEGPTVFSHRLHQQIYDLNPTLPLASALVPKPEAIDSGTTGIERMAVATGDFMGGDLKSYVAAWNSGGDTVMVTVPTIDKDALGTSEGGRLTFDGLYPFGSNRKIRLVTGNFFGDRRDEFVLAYHHADSSVMIQLCAFDSASNLPSVVGGIDDAKLMPHVGGMDNWDICAGDFDADGLDDLALLYPKPLGGGNWVMTAQIYTVDSTGIIHPKGSQEIFPRDPDATAVNVAAAAGRFDQDASEEIAFGFTFSRESNTDNTHVYLLDVTNDLGSILFSQTAKVTLSLPNVNEIQPFDIAAGDLNKNSRDELVIMAGSTARVYAFDGTLVPQYRSQRTVATNGENPHSDGFLAVEDMDLDRRAEVVVVKSFVNRDPGEMQHFEMDIFSFDDTLITSFLKARRLNERPVLSNTGDRHYAIALGDFDGDRIRLGDPVHFRRTGVLQPTVIVYTPPVHYDVFDTATIDLSGCYPDQDCGFTSTYVQSQNIDTTITTEVNEDWGGEASVEFALVAVHASVTASYGEKFAAREGSSKSYTITTGRVSAGDDWIYANVLDIDFYEYPVYDTTSEEPVGYFIVSVPGPPRPLWIEGKDDATLGNLFRPDHETGNVLSYPMEPTFDTSRVIKQFPEQTIGSTGSSFASLQISSFRENGIDSSSESGLEVGAKLDLMGDKDGFELGVEISAKGHYKQEEITTQTIKVGSAMEVRADLGHLGTQFGAMGTYHVTPYAYWTSYGALALDYMVSPLPTAGPTIWQQRYGGKTDPAFSLPWRYDPQKGYPLPGGDPSYRYRSRDIRLSSAQPHGGDTVRVGANVRNLALAALNPPVIVRFFLGDPDAGGTQIAEDTIDVVIPPRGSYEATAEWIIPVSEPLLNARLWAVVDPDNDVTGEVHEDNNKGWAPVTNVGVVTGVSEEPALVPSGFALLPSYPNPFNPSTTIRFELPAAAEVNLRVYNLLGQEVALLADGVYEPGRHHVHFQGQGLPSGVYFYRMTAVEVGRPSERWSATGRAMLVR